MSRLSFIGVLAALTVTLSSLHAEPYPKWLAIGDSITLHGPKPDLQWTGEARGMAASELSKDYVHVLEAKLKSKNPAHAADIKVVGRIGKLSAGTVDQMTTVLDELSAWGADLVTVQLGENDHLKDIGEEGFEQRYRMLIDSLLSNTKRPTIVCTGVWAPGSGVNPSQPTEYPKNSEPAKKDAIIEKICQEKGLRFVRIAAAANDKANYGWGETNGVKWHPNDAGMQAYADAIFGTLQAAQ